MTKTLRSLFVLMTICLLPLAAMAQTTYYVTADATTGDGSSWNNPMTLTNALTKAKAKDQIWVEAGTYRGSFSLKSGISLYGGFAGTESSIDERAIDSDKAYRMTHQTILSGDTDNNDQVDGVNLIFPANQSRDDNATHVLTINLAPTQQSGNDNTEPTIVDGITIKGGHADGVSEQGGGILVEGDNSKGGVYIIRRCFFIENYATQGGALYVASNVSNTNNNECLIDRCGFFNNAAGQRGNAINAGGAIYLAGAGTVVNCAVFNNENGGIYLANKAAKVINSTITRNTASGIDGDNDTQVLNTVIWGNSTLSSDNARPAFSHCAYPEVNAEDADSGNNVYLAAKNNEEKGPHFSSPSLKTGFDTDFTLSANNRYPLWTWEPIEATPLVDAGDSQAYDEAGYGNVDLNGDPRLQNGTIDIGAFEYQPVSTSRIRYVKQGGTGNGTSWDNASGDLQRMIDELADNNPQNLPGEVWVAAGIYEPQSQLIQGTGYSASFRMRDGISVYGGFASGESSKTEREKKEGGMPWEFKNQTVLMAAYYVRNESNPSFTGNKWTLTSDSRHVVWFAPMPGEQGTFTQPTYLDGVTIMGGYAQGGTGVDDFKTDRGAGVYMDGRNTYLTNSIVKENYATGNGGGVYLKDGRVQSTLIYNNNADQNGGAVYVDDQGLVHRSMLTNNSARNGAGVYLDNQPATQGEQDHPEYLILSTCVVSNNTASGNGAVYCDEGGVLLQNTITNNNCVTATDATDPNASQTGGIYINQYALVANSVIWNNRMSDGTNIPMYAKNPTADKVRFMYNAISGVNNAVWNNTLQEQTLSLVDQNAGTTDDPNSIGPRFDEIALPQDFNINTSFGIQESWKDSDEKAGVITYFWKPVNGSNLWARGMALGQLPSEVVIAPEIDIEGLPFAQKPGVGAFHVEKSNIVPALSEMKDNNRYDLIVYIDADCTEPEHHGSTWATAYRSINDAISYFASLDKNSKPSVIQSDGQPWTVPTMDIIDGFEIRVLEGDLWPRYAFVNEDPKTATLGILKMQSGKPLKIVGGYYRNEGSNDDVRRDPLNHRSQLNGNPDGDSLADGLYHVVTVESGATVELDGFHVINGYAAGTATLQYGAGMLVHDNAEVTLTNCIFENNTAVTGAAIDARNATLTMRNCVVNNNTNTEDVKNNAVINSDVDATTMQHVTIVNNTGAAVVDESFLSGTSFSKGNDAKNSIDGELATTGETGAANFANPTNGKGATLGFNTYLGGYASFRPLTSSPVAAELLINKVTNSFSGLDTDIMGNERDLGGVPDLGAYEADLPKAGKVIYVRSYNTMWDGDREESDGIPNMDISTAGDGSSWEKAINGNAICDLERKGISGTDAGFYINGGGSLRKASHDYTPYTTENQNYGPTSGSYGSLWNAEDNQQNLWSAQWGTYNQIGNKRYERYISGLQYAVEKAAEANANLAEGEDSVEVWVAAGIYTDYKGFVIRDRVRVLGGFPATGTPGESDRKPLLSDYIAANKDDADLTRSNYETILQVRKETPITWSANRPSANNWFKNLSGTQRHYTLYQPDECLPTWNIEGNNDRGWRTGANQYRYPYNGNTLADTQYYHNYKGATWDGFTVRHGYIKNYTSNRDGGAGVRAFRGVTLQNLVIVNNCNHNESYSNRNRGGGLYMDSDNGSINNSFIMQNCANYSNKGDNMGGGAYIIVGTGYNLVVANNYSAYEGGGIFIESATFYNNTVAFNYAQDGGSGLFQYQDPDDHTRASSLTLYNCLFYGNEGSDAISTTTVGTFNEAYNCYVAGSMSDDLARKFTVACGNQTNAINGSPLPNPFEDVNAQTSGNYRLAGTSTCVNRGVESIEQNGETINFDLPSTDMDYTNRIKDCTVDIGAYERDNEDTTQPDKNGVYYVTWTGFGNASADSPENAACADKLQTVLNAAGTRANSGQTAIVKIAGYENGQFVYHANTLSDENNPQSYTFVVPDGVTVMGGYFEGTFPNGVYQNDGWDEAKDDNVRNAVKFRTMLSATAVPTQGSTITQEVTGYHAVTFGEGDGTKALTKGATIDGVWLIDGSATSMAGTGNAATRGGGAIVPSGAHVRNCVVQGNTAIEGGGLYLLPGATVSGTAILDNSADNGGGVYADNTDMTDNTRSHIISCTIADNTADDGGGLFLEDGASMQVNTVIWGNEAPSNKNVSGVTGTRYADTQLASVFGNMNNGAFYPFNDCFVESQEMPSDFENSSMQSDEEVYFADELRTLKEFSPLIKHGVMNDYYNNTAPNKDFIDVFNVAESDMQGISRVQIDNGAERVDAGAFAFNGGILPTDLFTRIFVSQTENVKLREGENMLKYLGKSFYTAFSTLEDALAYVRSMRETDKGKDENFEILVSGGTYKPIYKRGDDESSPTVANDQRLYSFVVPHGVSIYGGFSGTEKYITPENMQFRNDKVTTIPAEDETINNEWSGEISTLPTRELSDFNGNGIKEPWELANQTILSGNINVSAEVDNVYHVLYTNATGVTAPNPVLLDGLTVMDGETSNTLSNVTNNDEEGRGGGLYSNGVGYTINRCRFIDNLGIRGGAVYVRDARLNVIGSIFAGNGWTDQSATTPDLQPARGGAIFIAGNHSYDVSLYAVNSLFVNNETIGDGGAIGTTYAEGITSNVDPNIDIMNCTFARNKAKMNAVVYNHNGKSHLTNTLIWGNESERYDDNTDAAEMQISHSASDHDYKGLFGDNNTDYNILLDEENTASNGPRFTRPSTTAGIAGNDATNLWNPSGISVATDKGDGVDPLEGDISGAYNNWFNNDLTDYRSQYMGEGYYRYSGPLDETTGQTGDRPIDIGVYEYQYISNFQTMEAIYVATEESGDHSGNSWANATSDLRGAIVGASHPKSEDFPRTIYVRDGEYALERLSAGAAFVLNFVKNPELANSNSLTLKGSCTGVGDAQNFANQTVMRNGSVSPDNLLQVSANEGNITIEGFTFINNSGTNANGINASADDNAGSLTLKNCALRTNTGTGVSITEATGHILIYNTLFADGGTGLNAPASENITLVNTTFANNSTADMSAGLTKVYNSVSWNNGAYHMIADEEGKNTYYYNKVFTTVNNDDNAATNNTDIQNGPNFVDPLNPEKEARDYHIRPSLTLLNQGSNTNYMEYVYGNAGASIPSTERDLGNSARLTDGRIDIGAYEYEAPLQPIVYVKEGLTVQNPDGKSWATALGDLQAAADLAGVYANGDASKVGYVFADYNVDVDNLRVTLPRTKVYGGMNNQTTDILVYDENGNVVENADIEGAVKDLLNKREGLIEREDKSELENVTISAEGSVVDGFRITGTLTINNGCLSTSIVDNNVTGQVDGLLYNTLVYGNVSDVKAVNVTATGTIPKDNANANNRPSVTETNSYVTTDHWKYQLMENDEVNLDKGNNQATEKCSTLVGHDRDIAGNKRIRNTVDNGCFETWNITADNVVTEQDYPHGQSVVYVRKGNDASAEGAELLVEKQYTASEPFNPGVLLLEHQAGLRVVDGNNVGLSYVIMERDVPADGVDMAYAPFSATIENNGVSLKYYDAAARAAYGYNKKDNGAWANFTGTYNGGYGLLLDNTQGSADAHVRFVGNSGNRNSYVYREGEGMNAPKQVSLKKENHSDPWTVDNPGTNNKFTAKENMSWNLFGSPYLCAMNYEDMEYGRVIYGYQNDTYVTVNTNAENTTPEGHIPAGDAIFTQTATLKDKETFAVDPRGSEKSGEAYGSMAAVKLSITHMDNARAAEGIAAGGDVLQLNTVTPEQARDDFDMGTDGVKWMADSVAQIYALQGGSRYSLLSAVNVEGQVSVGVTLPQPGMYTIEVPADCLADGYESVVLRDAATGKSVNLLEGGYDFSSATAGDIKGRFSISFNRMADDRQDDGIRAYSLSRGTIRVEGVAVGDRVSVYRTDGIMAGQGIASSTTEDVSANVSTVAIVKVERDGKTIAVKKIRVD